MSRMNPKLSLFVVVLLLLSIVLATFLTVPQAKAQTGEPKPLIINAYYASYGYNRFAIENIPADKLTHLSYAFANIDVNNHCYFSQPEDAPNIAKLQALRAAHPHLKLVLSVGGWGWSDNFYTAAAPENRAEFVQSCVDLMLANQFDGLDIDWEFPVRGGEETSPTPSTDAVNFTNLLIDLRAALDAINSTKHYELSIAAPASAWYANVLELDKIHQPLDYINLMTYAFYGGWAGKAGLDSAIYPPAASSGLSYSTTIPIYLNKGTPAKKIVPGFPAFANHWRNVADNGVHGLYQPATNLTHILYNELKTKYLSDPAYVQYWEETAHLPYMYNATKQEFIAYENSRSVCAKTDYVKEQGLGGLMFWELSQDSYAELTTAVHAGLTDNVPQLINPADSSIVTPTATTLEWNPAPAGTLYQLEIATNDAFSPTLMTQILTRTTYTVENITPGMSYYWRVTALTVCGVQPTSAVRTFTKADDMTVTAVDMTKKSAESLDKRVLQVTTTLVVVVTLFFFYQKQKRIF